MSYRGVIKSGVVVLDADVHLPEGQTVEVTAVGLNADILPAAGLWQDRTDIVDSGDESLQLRKSLEQPNR